MRALINVQSSKYNLFAKWYILERALQDCTAYNCVQRVNRLYINKAGRRESPDQIHLWMILYKLRISLTSHVCI
jgi:hypothetical protein